VAEAPQRLFFAVPVPPDVRSAVETILGPIAAGPLGRWARWVRTENLHLTVRFLGAVDPGLAGDLSSAVALAAMGVPVFRVQLAGAGAFPDGHHPRTLWLGVAAGNDGLEALGRRLEGPLAALGFAPDDRPRRPHLTVARTDATSGATSHALGDALRAATEGWRAEFEADCVALYRTHLGGGPPRYEAISEARLAG